MTTPNEHRKRIRQADAHMPAAIRNVLSQPETGAEATGIQQANQLRRIVKQLTKMETALSGASHQEAKEARRRLYLAAEHLLIAAHYLEGNV